MPKMRAFVKQPAAVVVLLVLLGVTAHAATITAFIEVFPTLDEFQAQVGPPDLAFNFNGLPDGAPEGGQLTLDGFLTLAGPFQITGGAVNFGGPASTAIGFAINFNGNNVLAFGTDIEALSGPGAFNFSVNGLSTLVNITEPGFIGFRVRQGRGDVPFAAINATFTPFDTATDAHFVIDNIIVNTVRAVPGPATLVLLAAGGAFVAVRLYTRRRTRARGRAAHEGDTSDPM